MSKLDFFISQFRGWKSKEKLCIIESDDWGSIRIPNKNVQTRLQKQGIDMSSNPYSRLDTIECNDDINHLSEILNKIEKKVGKKVKLTFNYVMANPNFSKIEENYFGTYYFENFTETYANNSLSNNVFQLSKGLIERKNMEPQMHAREHLNVSAWLEQLRLGNKDFLYAFKNYCFSIDGRNEIGDWRKNLLASYEYRDEKEFKFVEKSIVDANNLFSLFFSQKSYSTVAPRHVWNEKVEKVFANCGNNQIQTSINQLEFGEGKKYKIVNHYTGEVNMNNQIYTVRNIYFEPSYNKNFDWIGNAIKKINLLLMFNIPIIISMHRLNFVGGIEESNRTNNLIKFEQLITKICNLHPDIKFISSSDLGKKIRL